MKIVSLFTLLIVLGTQSLAQTKLIAFKSHAGNINHFEYALTNDDFDLACHNLGMVPTRNITVASLDSLIYISDTVAVMVTSEFCRDIRLGNPDPVQEIMIDSNLWKAGKDTVYNNPDFSRKNKDEVKTIIKEKYYFANDPDSVVFIGYDEPAEKEGKQKKRKKEAAPIVDNDNNSGNPLWFAYAVLAFISIGFGLIAWLKNTKVASAK